MLDSDFEGGEDDSLGARLLWVQPSNGPQAGLLRWDFG